MTLITRRAALGAIAIVPAIGGAVALPLSTHASDLPKLMAAHTAALAAWDAVPDEEWDEQQASLSRDVDRTRDALLAHRPSTLQEIGAKAEYMASTRSFHEWDDFDRVKLIEALTPVGGKS